MLATLYLLGLGWNFCFLSGTALVADSLKAVANKGRVQGTADAFVNIGSCAASASAGFFLEHLGFRGMAALGCGISVLPAALLVLLKFPRRVHSAVTRNASAREDNPIGAVAEGAKP